ncbi:MAG: hypothetical protein KA198_08625, partial [Chitinophagaceae bacterium]|nr:hypothetical protein [Chitinophagaceae bacterium]
MKKLSIIFLLLSSLSMYAQPFSAYTNIRQEFFVFDNGAINRIEPFAPTNYKVGRNAVAYLDNQQIFKVFKDGMVSVVNDLSTSNFEVSDNLVLY